jgi:hypothetical protein
MTRTRAFARSGTRIGRVKPLGRRSVVGFAGAGLLALAVAAGTATATKGETGTLTFHAELTWHGRTVDCPSGTASSVTCRMHEGSGVIPGLGPVSEQYIFFNEGGTAECPGTYRVSGFSARFTVGSKGTIEINTASSTIACRKSKG